MGFVVASDGSVEDPSVVRSSGFPDLDRAATQGVRNWRYHPATQGGKPIPVRTEAEVKWAVQ